MPNQKFWLGGDKVEVIKETKTQVEVRVYVPKQMPDGSVKAVPVTGVIKKTSADAQVVTDKNEVLKVDFVDVQQGDGSVIETPEGDVILVDGGDNQLFARYLASKYRRTTDTKPKEISCIIVTHGDADHFSGLTEIHKSEKHPTHWKRLFIHPENVFHNGLVKRPSTKNGKSRPDKEMFGKTENIKIGNKDVVVITELEENLIEVDDEKMNVPFKQWKTALEAFQKRGEINFRRLQKGDDSAFDFLKDKKVKIEVLGPIYTKTGDVEGLKFLGTPPKGVRIGDEILSLDDPFKGLDASHTVNGQSVVFRLSYGKFNFLFTGDLNDEAERILTREHESGNLNLQSDVIKVPHHGSHDFSSAFLKAVSPAVSIISSGDESLQKEYIHPRANLVGSLGKFSRDGIEPIIFITELVAFFSVEGYISDIFHQLTAAGEKAAKSTTQKVVNPKTRKRFFSFSRTAFGLVKIRTDGNRLLVFTDSAKEEMKEAYVFKLKANGKIEAANPIIS